MNDFRSIDERKLPWFSFAANIVLALALVAGMPTTAMAIDCSTWSSAQGEDRDRAFEGAVDELLSSPRAEQWTTLNIPLIKDCLLASRGRIQVEWDGLCAKGMETSMEALDTKLYEYARGCVRA
jgi:hypothetical protein